MKKDSTRNFKVTAFPIVYYLPETGFGYGGLGLATFRFGDEAPESRPSSFQLGVSLTTKKQFLLFAPFELYWDDEKWRLLGELGYYKYFYNFYGVGIDTRIEDEDIYEVTYPRLRLSLLREVLTNFSVGPAYELDVFGGLVIREDGILSASDVPGKREGTVSNIGIVANYDSRDDIFYPTRGFFIQAKGLRSAAFLGSTFDYSKFELDNRYYQKIGKQNVLAGNLVVANSSNNTPFYDLYYLGDKSSRGFNNRRYQDNALLNFALEYRFHIFGRFGGVAFGSTGTVAPELGTLFSSSYKSALGAGLRYVINKKEGARIRVDYGYTKDGGNFYFTLMEAF